MSDPRPSPQNIADPIPRMPSWIVPGRGQSLEEYAFLSGAALSHLAALSGHDAVPQELLRARLALRAAEAGAALAGRPERAGELRDALHFLRPGDLPGPAGEIWLAWRRAVERPVSVRALQRALPGHAPGRIAAWLDAGQGTGQRAPVARAAAVLETVLADCPRQEDAALILAEAALARALGRDHILPLLAAGLSPRALRRSGEDLRLACHRALVVSAAEAARMAAALARGAARLRAVAPGLRARGAEEAVGLFLSRDALAPPELAGLMSDRAARRFCDRLAGLGAVRELTGRDTFRLYGVAP